MKNFKRAAALVVLAAGFFAVSLSSAEAGGNHFRGNGYNRLNLGLHNTWNYGYQNQFNYGLQQQYNFGYRNLHVRPIYVKPCNLNYTPVYNGFGRRYGW